MSSSAFIRHFRRAAARYAMLTFAWLIEVLPFPIVKAAMQGCLAIAFRVAKRQRKIARESLRIAFGREKTGEEIEAISDRCFQEVGTGFIELMYYSRYPEKATAVFSLEGREHLEAARQKGKGVILVTAHFGNFPLMMLALAQMGYPVNCILRRARDGKVADRVLSIMDRCQVHTIYTHPRTACVQKSIKALRNNELLFVLLDQNFGSEGGVFVDFFGRKAATAPGPAIFAIRTGAPILPVFDVREVGRHRVVFEPELPLIVKDSDEETIPATIAAITRIIERYIRRYPQAWGWMHRRWKTQGPDAEGNEGVTNAFAK